MTWTPPSSATDACSGSSLFGQPNRLPGSTFQPGAVTVQYTATDNLGNTGVCSFAVNVIVNETVAPIINCSALQTVTVPSTNCTNGTLTASLFTQQPTFSDNCAMHPTQPIRIVTVLPVTLAVGTTSITWEAKDAAGNVAQCQQSVIIKETTPPSMICLPYPVQVDIPGNLFISSTSSLFHPFVPVVADNCGITPSATNPMKMDELAQYNIGVSHLMWKATDNAGQPKPAYKKSRLP